jgi:hypothetical protein
MQGALGSALDYREAISFAEPSVQLAFNGFASRPGLFSCAMLVLYMCLNNRSLKPPTSLLRRGAPCNSQQALPGTFVGVERARERRPNRSSRESRLKRQLVRI